MAGTAQMEREPTGPEQSTAWSEMDQGLEAAAPSSPERAAKIQSPSRQPEARMQRSAALGMKQVCLPQAKMSPPHARKGSSVRKKKKKMHPRWSQEM